MSGVALLCTLMLLIGILPMSVLRNNQADAAGSGDYKLRIVYPTVVSGNNPYYNNMYIHLWDSSGPVTGSSNPVKMDRTNHVYEINMTKQATSYITTPADNWNKGQSGKGSLDWTKADGNVLTLFVTGLTDTYTLNTTYIEPSTKLYKIKFDLSDVYSQLSPLDGISTFGIGSSGNTECGPFYVDELESGIYNFDYFDKQYNKVALTIHSYSNWNITFSNLDWSQVVDDTLVLKVTSLTNAGTGLSGETLYTPTFEYGKQPFAGETLYITGASSTPTVKFYDKNNSQISSGTINTIINSNNLTNYNDKGNNSYSVVIPEGATQVSFNSGTKMSLSDYYSKTSNAYNLTSGSWVSYTEPYLNSSTLYIDATDSGYTTPITIKYGTQSGTMTSVEGSIYKYQFTGSSLATKDTQITISGANGKSVNLYYNPSITTKNMFNLKDSTWSQQTADFSGKIYFDATLSKLSYAGTTTTDYPMPSTSGTLRYYLIGDGVSDKEGDMTQVSGKDIYYVDLGNDKEKYTKIVFSTFDMSSSTNYGGHGESTSQLTIPKDMANPCFYADTSDSVIYDGGTRSGYWGELGSVRDAETGKASDVVEIDKSTTFTKNNSTLYVNSTFYDYYTDYELNGYNRKDYDSGTNEASQRNWVNFRQFDQALSDYYRTNNVGANNAIYTGQFQPSITGWGFPFSNVAGTLNLYGWDNYNVFMSNNNSALNSNGANSDSYYDAATQNIVSSKLSNGLPTSYNTSTVLPYFNETFLNGDNSKNTKLGEVYHNVSFPFTQKDVKSNGVNCWVFDSAETTLAMKQDKDTGEYFLKDVGKQNWSKNVDSESSDKNTYGFFPFNENTTATSAKNYNYGFGTKLEFKFRLTDDGTVKDKNNNSVPIEFEFSGDDDVWVFIDGQLVLDVGGDHGRVTGTIDFKDLTSTVSYVKKSANNSTEGANVTKNITVLNNTTNSDGTPTAANNMATEHTLTMFYMERGMWESNMEIQFNFPDENQLEVEKEVEKTDVNALFAGLFDNQSIFDFTIQNLATHYGTKAVDGVVATPITFNDTFASDTLPAVNGALFAQVSAWNGQTNVVHWYAKLSDTTGEYRENRWGTVASSGNPDVDISNMKYLTFKYYYDYNDTPSLNNMYIQLVDANGNTLGSLAKSGDYLSGKTYGTVNMTNYSWQTIKVDLSKLTDTGGFDKTKLKYIRFGYNYPRNIYLDDFIFEPSASAGTTASGFITKQYEIPDYGSANSGKLENATGAKYTSSNDGTTDTYIVDSKGGFSLRNEETIIFRDQFRRGSYIALTENLTDAQKKLFDTSYTVYENGQAVTSFGTGSSTITNSSVSTLKDVHYNSVNDGRTEKIITSDAEGMNPSTGNAYKGTKPLGNTFVFRSYADPDNTTVTTKLKVVYTNKVNTNSLTIKKAQAAGSQTLNGTYTFVVEFYNIGGIGLESEHQFVEFTLGVGDSKTITGIPVGTDYKIYEIKGEDSVLQAVNNETNSFTITTYDGKDAYSVSGTIPDTDNTDVSYIFSNYKKEVVSLELSKNWNDTDGYSLTDNLPESINVQLERKTDSDTDWETVESVEVNPGYESWSDFKYIFKDLDKYKDNNESNPYSYRVVELDNDWVVQDGKTVTIDDKNWIVTYGDVTLSADGKTYYQTITNIAEPTYTINIRKVDAENANKYLSGAKFTLSQNIDSTPLTFKDNGNGDYEYSSSGTITELVTNEYGQITITGLSKDSYNIQEVTPPPGYTNDKNGYYEIDFNSGKIKYDNTEVSESSKIEYYESIRTATLTISNRQIVLPETGGSGFNINFVFMGLTVILIAGITFVIINRKTFYKKKP